MTKLKTYLKKAEPFVKVAAFLYKNRAGETALVLSVIALGREVIQIATGH